MTRKIFVATFLVLITFLSNFTYVDAAGAVFRDARINLGGSYFGATGGLTPAPTPTAPTGVGLTDVPATGIEVNAYTVSFAILMLIVSIMIARQAYLVQIENEKNRERKVFA